MTLYTFCLTYTLVNSSYNNTNFFFVSSLQSRLKPGRMLLVDTKEKSLIQDVELKSKIAKSRPHGEWLQQQVSTHAACIKTVITVFFH